MRVKGERLLSARKAAGLSRAELSKAIDLSVPSIWRIEEAGQMPSAEILVRWAEACGVTANDLITDAASAEDDAA